MIDYIVYDNQVEQTEKVIDCVMMNNSMEYKVHKYGIFEKNFRDIIEKKSSYKVYILNIDVKGVSSLEIARLVRESDVDSILIFCSENYEKYQKDLIKSRFTIFDFIDKCHDYESELKISIEAAIQQFNRKNAIRFKSQSIVYTIVTKDILYIMRNKDRTCTIQMSENSIVVKGKSLKYFMGILDDRFVRTHRACIVNYDRIVQYNQKNRTILFDNNMGTDLVSSSFKMGDE